MQNTKNAIPVVPSSRLGLVPPLPKQPRLDNSFAGHSTQSSQTVDTGSSQSPDVVVS